MISPSFLLCSALLGYFSSCLIILLPHRAFGLSRNVYLDQKNVDADVTIKYNHRQLPAYGFCSVGVIRHGYKCQEFQVVTDDGYILSVVRIPQGRAVHGGPNRPPVLLQHGILVDGATWLLNSPEESLAMILADNGFDVWISNTRGTRYSRRHVSLDPKNPKFWDWTWDDLVTYELPAIIHLMFGQTDQKIHYVGHSLGTSMVLASLSEGKDIFHKLRSAALLSPIAYLSHMTTALGNIAAKAFLGEIAKSLGVAEFNPRGEPVEKFLTTLCSHPGVNCFDLITALTGKNCCLNASTVEIFLKNEPQSTATKNLVHLAQTVRSGTFSKYDYGNAKENFEHYGEPKPPPYDLTKIPRDFPLFLSYGGQDSLSDVKDVTALLDLLDQHDMLEVQFVKNYGHADFILGVTAKDIVYNRIVAFFRKQK